MVKATASEMIELLEGLAYGFGSTPGLAQSEKTWRDRLMAKRMRVDLKAAARELGIEGISRMRNYDYI